MVQATPDNETYQSITNGKLLKMETNKYGFIYIKKRVLLVSISKYNQLKTNTLSEENYDFENEKLIFTNSSISSL